MEETDALKHDGRDYSNHISFSHLHSHILQDLSNTDQEHAPSTILYKINIFSSLVKKKTEGGK